MKKQSAANFSLIKRGRVSDEIINQIKGLIFSGDLTVGDRLPPERDLAEQLGVSRVPVREALLSLEQSGLLTIKRGLGGGVFVSEPNMKPFEDFIALMLHLGRASVRDLTEARLIIEPYTAKLAAERASIEDLEKIEDSIRQYEKVVEQKAERSFRDMSFHIRVAEASQNIVVILTIRSLMLLLYKSVVGLKLADEDRRKVIKGHKEVFDAIKARNPEEAFKRMMDHVTKMKTLWKS